MEKIGSKKLSKGYSGEEVNKNEHNKNRHIEWHRMLYFSIVY